MSGPGQEYTTLEGRIAPDELTQRRRHEKQCDRGRRLTRQPRRLDLRACHLPAKLGRQSAAYLTEAFSGTDMFLMFNVNSAFRVRWCAVTLFALLFLPGLLMSQMGTGHR